MDKAPVILTILLGVVLVRGGAEAPEGQPSLKTTFEPTACDDGVNDGDDFDGDDDDDDDHDDDDYNVISAGLGHMCPNPQNGLFQCF